MHGFSLYLRERVPKAGEGWFRQLAVGLLLIHRDFPVRHQRFLIRRTHCLTQCLDVIQPLDEGAQAGSSGSLRLRALEQ
ncbi:hypothetical protein DBO85_03385 [Pseudomonas mangrovi]|uniref:Uncharacterized protein n=1 Tax=Pseudomonas mangrovi TaxID=2161748 RepID=A0A2T5PDC0_9PSED|nr:hypothetical protein DBO85_03385 [Pseudomonas mangrovi]